MKCGRVVPKLAFAVVLLWMTSFVHWHEARPCSPAAPILGAGEGPCQLCILARTGAVKATPSIELNPYQPAFLGIASVREIWRANPTFLFAELRGPPPQALN